MDENTARDYLARGLWRISEKQAKWSQREGYYRGRQKLPYAPPGVSAEYLDLREMAVANWLGLAMDTPVQRLRAEGFRTGRDADADRTTWDEVWQPNDLDARQRIVYTQMMVHGRGLMSVWPNPKDRKSPVIRPENGQRVHVEMRPDDPFTAWWAVKTYTIDDRQPGLNLFTPKAYLVPPERSVAVVYDDESWVRFEKGGNTMVADWEVADAGTHPLGELPFVPFDNRVDSDGKPYASIDPLIPAQDAINTIRFQTLLAMQFSAYRQRIFVGYDPVVRDTSGNVIYQKNPDGSTVTKDGVPVPMLNSFGRLGVDRALVFPGADTKVFDLPESNLSNYIAVLSEFLTDLFAIGQIPPQYLLTRMANLSGDALAGAESTLASLVSDLQRWTGDSLKRVMRLAGRARGEDLPDIGSEVLWADAEARSFAQVIDAITKLIAAEFPRQAAWEMIPGANPEKVRRWEEMRVGERDRVGQGLDVLAEAFRQPPPAEG